MSALLLPALLAIFLVHLVVFAWIGWRRRQGYHALLVLTFLLLSLAVGLRMWAPEWAAGAYPVHQWLRGLAWLSAAVSISWAVQRYLKRRRAG